MLGDNAAVYIIRSQCNDAKFQMEKRWPWNRRAQWYPVTPNVMHTSI